MKKTENMLNYKGKPRHVGFEIEYIGIENKQCARIIQELYGGNINVLNENTSVIDTMIGQFKVKVDVLLLEKLSQQSEINKSRDQVDFEGIAHELISPFLTSFMPSEIIAPPLKEKAIGQLERLVEALRQNKAKGTGDSIFYAFGLHINPEVCSISANSILTYLQAFGLLQSWLKKNIPMDNTRILSFFAQLYPEDYLEMILNAHYRPELEKLIEDYMVYITSRNYALDCLPLFLYLKPELVKVHINDPLITPRPTYHFRMTNSRVDEKNWTIQSEYRYWQLIEYLANASHIRKDLAQRHLNADPTLDDEFTKLIGLL